MMHVPSAHPFAALFSVAATGWPSTIGHPGDHSLARLVGWTMPRAHRSGVPEAVVVRQRCQAARSFEGTSSAEDYKCTMVCGLGNSSRCRSNAPSTSSGRRASPVAEGMTPNGLEGGGLLVVGRARGGWRAGGRAALAVGRLDSAAERRRRNRRCGCLCESKDQPGEAVWLAHGVMDRAEQVRHGETCCTATRQQLSIRCNGRGSEELIYQGRGEALGFEDGCGCRGPVARRRVVGECAARGDDGGRRARWRCAAVARKAHFSDWCSRGTICRPAAMTIETRRNMLPAR